MSGLLACVGKSFVEPPHTIRLKFKMRHAIRLFDRKISVGYGRFDFAGANDGGEVADAHPCSRHEVDPGPGPGSPREASVELLLLFPFVLSVACGAHHALRAGSSSVLKRQNFRLRRIFVA